MAKANFVKKAQKDIFVNGKQVEWVEEKMSDISVITIE